MQIDHSSDTQQAECCHNINGLVLSTHRLILGRQHQGLQLWSPKGDRCRVTGVHPQAFEEWAIGQDTDLRPEYGSENVAVVAHKEERYHYGGGDFGPAYIGDTGAV